MTRLKWLSWICEQCSYPLGPFDATRYAVYPVECPSCGYLNVITITGDEENDPVQPRTNGRIDDVG